LRNFGEDFVDSIAERSVLRVRTGVPKHRANLSQQRGRSRFLYSIFDHVQDRESLVQLPFDFLLRNRVANHWKKPRQYVRDRLGRAQGDLWVFGIEACFDDT